MSYVSTRMGTPRLPGLGASRSISALCSVIVSALALPLLTPTAQATTIIDGLTADPLRPVPFLSLQRNTDGAFRKLVFLVARSPDDWNLGMRKLESEGALWVVPGPPPPENVNWSNEAVVLIGTGSGDLGVTFQSVWRKGSDLYLGVDFSNTGSDPVESSPYQTVCMEKWSRLAQVASSGDDAVSNLHKMLISGSPDRRGLGPKGAGAIEMAAAGPSVSIPRITAGPNPFRDRVVVEYQGLAPGPVRFSIVSADGRLVRSLDSDSPTSESARMEWDGRDAGGRSVSPGVYYARVTTSGGSWSRAIVRAP